MAYIIYSYMYCARNEHSVIFFQILKELVPVVPLTRQEWQQSSTVRGKELKVPSLKTNQENGTGLNFFFYKYTEGEEVAGRNIITSVLILP